MGNVSRISMAPELEEKIVFSFRPLLGNVSRIYEFEKPLMLNTDGNSFRPLLGNVSRIFNLNDALNEDIKNEFPSPFGECI